MTATDEVKIKIKMQKNVCKELDKFRALKYKNKFANFKYFNNLYNFKSINSIKILIYKKYS